jgi:hypothetical protein
MRRRGFDLRLYFLGPLSRSREFLLNFLELPLQHLGLAFELLDLLRIRRRLRAGGGGMEQPHAKKARCMPSASV